MHIASLVLWVVTAVGGLLLLGTWLSRGGLRQQEPKRTRFPVPLIFGQAGLAALGLALWIVYVFTDNHTIARAPFGLLAVVVVLGVTMFARWRGQHKQALGTRAERPAEDHFPRAVVYGHGVLGAATLAFVLLTAFELVG